MQKSLFSFIIDFIFNSLIIFAISFIWLRLYIHDNTLILIISLIITFFVSLLLSFIVKNKIKKYKLSKSEAKLKRDCKNSLIFMTNTELIEYLSGLYKEKNIKKYKEYFTILGDDAINVFFQFSLTDINEDFIINAVKQCEKDKISNLLVYGISFSKTAQNMVKNIKNFNIKLIDYNSLFFSVIKNQNFIPVAKIKYEEKTKYSFKELLSIAFNKTKTKSYVVTGLIFLVSSLFLRYNIYYIVFTTIMLVFALFSYFNKSFNKKTDEKI